MTANAQEHEQNRNKLISLVRENDAAEFKDKDKDDSRGKDAIAPKFLTYALPPLFFL